MKKLNVGCGRDIREGYVNLDIVPFRGVDLICDLDELCGAHPSAIEAAEVVLETDEVVTGISFAVGELIFQSQQAGQPNSILPGIKRLDRPANWPITDVRE